MIAFIKNFISDILSSPILSRLSKGMFWSICGTLISRGLILVASFFIARILGKTCFGEFGMIQATMGMFGILGGTGLGLTATKYVAEFRQTDPEKTGRIIILTEIVAIFAGGLMALGLIIFAQWLAENTINAPQLAGSLRIGSLVTFLSALNGAQIGALSGFEAFKTIAYVNFFVGLVSFPILVLGTYFGGLDGAIWALAINLCFNVMFNHIALKKERRMYKVPINFKKCSQEISILWKFSFPAVLSTSLVVPVNWLCATFLVNQIDGYEEMGIFNAANQWYTMLMILPSLLGNVILPILSEQIGQKSIKQSKKTIKFAIKANSIFVLPSVIIISIASPYIMGLYGDSFRDGGPTLIIVILTTVFVAIQTPVGQIIASSGKMWIGFLMNIGWAITFIIGTRLLVDKGSIGLALARAIGYVFHMIWSFGIACILIHSINQHASFKQNEKC